MEQITHTSQVILPLAVFLVLLALFLGLRALMNWKFKDKPERGLLRQWLLFVFFLAGTVVVIAVLPIKDSLRGQILSLLGIILSAAIALSSTSFLGNALAGMLMRGIRNFRIGDFIMVNEHLGRVTARGLLHIEIQGEDRNLTCLPNLYLLTNPVKVYNPSGTIVSVDLSLGYELPWEEVESILSRAAENAGLEEPFVLLKSLGDFSVTYSACGLLAENRTFLSARSKLIANILDAMRDAKVEIVSPNFMNTRNVADKAFIPPRRFSKPAKPAPEPEETIFDKADRAQEVEEVKEGLRELEEALKEVRHKQKDGEAKKRMESEIKMLEKEKESLEKELKEKSKE